MEVFPADSFFSYFSPFCLTASIPKVPFPTQSLPASFSLFWQGFTINLQFPQFPLSLQPSRKAGLPMPTPAAYRVNRQPKAVTIWQTYPPCKTCHADFAGLGGGGRRMLVFSLFPPECSCQKELLCAPHHCRPSWDSAQQGCSQCLLFPVNRPDFHRNFNPNLLHLYLY